MQLFTSIEETILRGLVNVPERAIVHERQRCLSSTANNVRIRGEKREKRYST